MLQNIRYQIIIIIIIIIGKGTISFMQGICTYTPETNHVPKEKKYCRYPVATVYGAHITSSNVFLHQHFPNYVCSAQYGSFL
jgi:hypothetical protein